jgi:hypothetical protein
MCDHCAQAKVIARESIRFFTSQRIFALHQRIIALWSPMTTEHPKQELFWTASVHTAVKSRNELAQTLNSMSQGRILASHYDYQEHPQQQTTKIRRRIVVSSSTLWRM